MNIIMALPSSGKTTLAKSFPGTFVDTDPVLTSLFGSCKGIRSSYAKEQVCRLTRTIVKDFCPRAVLTNLHWSPLKGERVIGVLYSPSDYIDHIIQCGRVDLIDNFGVDKLLEAISEFDHHLDTLKSQGYDVVKVTLSKGEYLHDSSFVRDLVIKDTNAGWFTQGRIFGDNLASRLKQVVKHRSNDMFGM